MSTACVPVPQHQEMTVIKEGGVKTYPLGGTKEMYDMEKDFGRWSGRPAHAQSCTRGLALTVSPADSFAPRRASHGRRSF